MKLLERGFGSLTYEHRYNFAPGGFTGRSRYAVIPGACKVYVTSIVRNPIVHLANLGYSVNYLGVLETGDAGWVF
jgi:hypothetical protein